MGFRGEALASIARRRPGRRCNRACAPHQDRSGGERLDWGRDRRTAANCLRCASGTARPARASRCGICSSTRRFAASSCAPPPPRWATSAKSSPASPSPSPGIHLTLKHNGKIVYEVHRLRRFARTHRRLLRQRGARPALRHRRQARPGPSFRLHRRPGLRSRQRQDAVSFPQWPLDSRPRRWGMRCKKAIAAC